MQFILILAVLAALGISEGSPNQPVSAVTGRLILAGGGIALVAMFAMVVSGMTARRLRADFGKHPMLLRRFRRLRQVHAALWLAITGGILYGLEWGQVVRFNWHLDRAFLLDDLLILAPVLLPLVLSWAAFYEVDRAVCVGSSGGRFGLGDRAAVQRRVSSRRRYLLFHLRHYQGMLLGPVLVLLAVQDAVDIFAPELVESGHTAVVFIPTLAMLFLLFPVLLRCLWQTEPLPRGPLRDRLERAARRSGFFARDMLIWHTDGMVLNAAVAGFTRRVRYVFLTDALLQRLEDEEIEAVFGHEMGHVCHHHLSLRVMAMIAPLSLWLLLGQACPVAVDRLEVWLGAGGLGLQAQLGLVILGVTAAYVFVVFGYYSRLLEHQADLFACRCLAPDSAGRPVETFTSALEKLANSAAVDRNARSWQHASIARRVEFLNLLSRDPNRELHFHRRVRLLGGIVIGILVSPVVFQLLFG